MKKLTKFVLLLLVVGVVCCVTAVSMGVTLEPFTYQETAQQQGLSEFHRLVLDIDIARVIIRRSDAEKRSLTAGKSTVWETSGDTLTIRQEDTKGWILEKKPADIILTLNGGDAESLDLELNGGSVFVSDLHGLQHIKCDINGGTVEITNVLADQVKADVSDAGRLTFTGRTLGPVQLSCENGYIRTEL